MLLIWQGQIRGVQLARLASVKERMMYVPRTHGVVVRCFGCLELITLYVAPLDYEAWLTGTHAQDVFPYLTDGERELLISNTCDKCFEEMFPEEEEEEWYPEDDSDYAIDPESDLFEYSNDWYVD
jgi:hypothetical protein